MLRQFPHALHGFYDCLCPRRLFLHRRIDFVGDLVQTGGGPGDLRRTVRLFVGGRPDFLGELVNFGDYVGNLAQRRIQLLTQVQAFVHNVGAFVHVLDGLARFLLNTLDQFGNLLGGLR